MKILYHHRVASKDGQYVHIEEIINSLKKLGHQVELVAPAAGENQEFGGDGGVVSKLKAKIPQFLYEIMEFSYTFWAAIKLFIAVSKHKPDFIYERFNLLHPAGIWISKLTKTPILLEVNAPLLEERSKYDGLSLQKLARWSQGYCWKNADAVLPVTQVLADIVTSYGVAQEKITVIPNGINADEFIHQTPKPHLPVDVSNKTVIGFVGFCRDWHGLDKIVALLTKPGNEHLFFLLVGDGPSVEGIKQYAKQHQIEDRIYITGIVQRNDMPGWLIPIDIALQPAVVDYASPLKMLEYMATEKAIVAPDQPNIRELLTHDHDALLFNPDDQQGFVAACEQLANDADLRARVSANAKATVYANKLFWDDNAKTIVGIAQAEIAKGKK